MALLPPDGHLYPAVGMHSEGEEVKVILDAEWHYEDLELMAVDDGEDDWSRLYDVKLNGTVRLPMIYIASTTSISMEWLNYQWYIPYTP